MYKKNAFSHNGVQMVALFHEETGLGHNENKSADESAFFEQFANCVKAMVWVCLVWFCFVSIQHPNLS